MVHIWRLVFTRVDYPAAAQILPLRIRSSSNHLQFCSHKSNEQVSTRTKTKEKVKRHHLRDCNPPDSDCYQSAGFRPRAISLARTRTRGGRALVAGAGRGYFCVSASSSYSSSPRASFYRFLRVCRLRSKKRRRRSADNVRDYA